MSTEPHSDTPAPLDRATVSATRRRRRVWGRIAYAAFLLLFVEGSLQLFYRVSAGDWLFRRIALPIYAADDYRGWTVKPNLRFRHTTHEFSVDYITNSQGFRTDDPSRIYVRPKPPGVYRIMLMGPSFAFGWANSYSDTLGARMEQSLLNAPELKGRAVEVINAGVPSLAWPIHQRWYDQVGRTYEPDLLILIHYGDMILDENPDELPLYSVNVEGYLVTAKTDRWHRLRVKAKRSAILFYGYVVCQRIADARHNRSSGSAGSSEGTAGVPPRSNSPGKGMIATRKRVEAFRDLARNKGQSIILVHIPLGFTVHRQDAKRRGIDDRQIQKTIEANAAVCQNLQETTGVPCVDLMETFQKQTTPIRERLYFHLDPHFTPLGNQIAAEAIAETIRETLRKL